VKTSKDCRSLFGVRAYAYAVHYGYRRSAIDYT